MEIVKSIQNGVPAVVQWVKCLTVVVWVTEEAWVQSLAQCSRLKDPGIAVTGAQIQSLAPELLYAVGATKKEKKKKDRGANLKSLNCESNLEQFK